MSNPIGTTNPSGRANLLVSRIMMFAFIDRIIVLFAGNYEKETRREVRLIQ